MAAIWSEQSKFRIWFEIEALAAEAMADRGQIPKAAANAIRRAGKAEFDVARVREIEQETRHEFASFVAYLGELAGPENARFLHRGMTSSDALDTCFNLQLCRASDLLLDGLGRLADAFKRRAMEFKYAACPGRSHGMHAEPVTFGLKMAQAFAEARRNAARIEFARQEVATGAISGAMGTFANIDPEIEAAVCERLGLRPEPTSTQVIPRDRHAMYFATLGVAAASVERIAVEIRSLQRTEIGEASEAFHDTQIGSSAMPHKRNPILSENLTGLARLVRSCVAPSLENVALWHERDMSHSSVERVTGPGATAVLDFAIHRLASVVDGLVVREDRMARNLALSSGTADSQAVMLALARNGMDREIAYRTVQQLASEAADSGRDFGELLRADPKIAELLPEQELEAILDGSRHTRNVDRIFDRVFGD